MEIDEGMMLRCAHIFNNMRSKYSMIYIMAFYSVYLQWQDMTFSLSQIIVKHRNTKKKAK